jgi:CRP-like cAMP-binding protein
MPKSQIIRSYLEKAAILESVDDRDRFLPYLELLIFAEGEEILRQGDVGSELYILVQGSIRIVAEYKDFVDKVAIIADRGVIGEIAFTTKYGKRTASVYAETNCVLLKLTRERFDNFRVKFPDAANEFLLQLAESLGEKLARTTEALVSVERNMNAIGQDYGVDDFSDILKHIDNNLNELVVGENTGEGAFVAPPG